MRRIFETQQKLMAHRIEDALRGRIGKKIRPMERKRLTESELDASQNAGLGRSSYQARCRRGRGPL
jgi:hypothetical protein